MHANGCLRQRRQADPAANDASQDEKNGLSEAKAHGVTIVAAISRRSRGQIERTVDGAMMHPAIRHPPRSSRSIS